MSQSELQNYLAAAADLLRGSIDQADFKAYIFPLMFFKRISDVYLKTDGTPIIVENIVNRIDEVVRGIRFEG